jgi:hypothetical protein
MNRKGKYILVIGDYSHENEPLVLLELKRPNVVNKC